MSTLCTFLLSAAMAFPTVVFAAPDRALPAGGPRVRPQDGRTAMMLLEGIQRSDTMRTLVEQLETSDVIVYIEIQPRLRGMLAGKLTWLTAARGFRYVRISISPELTGVVAISTLGHELRHALEVAHEPSIISDGSLSAFYRRTGISMKGHRDSYDTQAARDAGEEVRREAATTRSVRLADAGPFDPAKWHIVYRMARDHRF